MKAMFGLEEKQDSVDVDIAELMSFLPGGDFQTRRTDDDHSLLEIVNAR
jgi:hypothetical protein